MSDHTLRKLARAAGALTVGAALLATAGCAATEPQPSGDGSGDAAHIIVATPTPPGTPAGVPIWIGEKNGYFEEENLTVEVVTFPGQPANAVSAVVAGQADLVISAPAALVAPTANGDDLGLTWIFTPYQAPTFAIVVAKDSDIKSAADLVGKTVAMPSTGAPFEPFLNGNIKGEGGNGTANIVTEAGAVALQHLDQGVVDAIVANPSDIAQAEAVTGIETRTLPLADAVADEFGAGFLMRTDATDEQKDAYARYLRAYLKSAIFAQENPEAAVRLNWEIYPDAKATDLSEEQALKASIASMIATVDLFVPAENGQWGYIAPERWELLVANLGLAGKIDDLSVLYDYSLLDAISDFDADQVREDAAAFGE